MAMDVDGRWGGYPVRIHALGLLSVHRRIVADLQTCAGNKGARVGIKAALRYRHQATKS